MTYYSVYQPKRQNIFKRLWKTAKGVWLIVLLLLIGSYTLFTYEMYNIVGGLQ